MARARIDDESGTAAVATVAAHRGGPRGRRRRACARGIRRPRDPRARGALHAAAARRAGARRHGRGAGAAVRRGAVRRGAEAHARHAAERDRDGCRDLARPRHGRPHVGRRPRVGARARVGPARRPARPPAPVAARSPERAGVLRMRRAGQWRGERPPRSSTAAVRRPSAPAPVGDDVERVEPGRGDRGRRACVDASSASRLDEPVETDVTDDIVTVRRAPRYGRFITLGALVGAVVALILTVRVLGPSPRMPSSPSASTRARCSGSSCCCAATSAPRSAPSSRS